MELGQYQRALIDYSSVLEQRRTPWDYLNRSAVYSLLKLDDSAERDSGLAFKLLDEIPNAHELPPFEGYAFNRLSFIEENIKHSPRKGECS